MLLNKKATVLFRTEEEKWKQLESISRTRGTYVLMGQCIVIIITMITINGHIVYVSISITYFKNIEITESTRKPIKRIIEKARKELFKSNGYL